MESLRTVDLCEGPRQLSLRASPRIAAFIAQSIKGAKGKAIRTSPALVNKTEMNAAVEEGWSG